MSWLAGWEHRLKLTVDSSLVDGTLTWFPVMVRISASSGIGGVDVSAVFDELGTESLKIAVTQANGYTENYVEVDKWDSSGEDAILWVSKDGWEISSSADTVLYLYYDSTHDDNSDYVGVVGSTAGEKVWDANFKAVHHMGDNPDTSHIIDSTSNDNDGTKKGANEPIEVAGKTGKAQQFDGTDDYIALAVQASIKDINIGTLTILYKGDPAARGPFTVSDISTLGANEIIVQRIGDKLAWCESAAGPDDELKTTDDTYTAGAWHLFSAMSDGSTMTMNVNGEAEAVSVHSGANHGWFFNDLNWSLADSITIGALRRPSSVYYNGIVDQLFISDAVRSAAWLLATYYTCWDTLITFSVEDTTAANYMIEVDWNNDGGFYDTYDDITSNVKSVSYSRGKSDELGKAEVGQCSVTVNNADGLYSPSLSTGNLYGSLFPKRPIQVWALYSGTKYDLFYGFIEEIIPHPHLSEQDCIIIAVDGIDFLSRHDMATALYKDTVTGAVHTYILDDAVWSATMRTIDTGQDTVPFWYGHDVKARFAQEEIDDSEQGFSYIGGNGYFNFEDRHHRSSATHQTSQGTFTNTMAYITYSLNAKNVYNEIKVRVTPWEVQSIAELWRLDETPSIPAGETSVWWGDASVSGESVFVDAWTTPASTTDYTANSLANGTGTDMTSDITITTTKFAKSIKLSIKNNGVVPAFLTLLKARGTYYDDLTKVTRKADDSTSQTAYQKRTLEIDGKYMTDADKAQDLASYAIAKYKDPRAEMSMEIINQDATNLTQLLSREISDRITVVNTKLGINDDYFIDYMQHDISLSGKLHTATYRLADTINEDFWCLDYSALASSSSSGQTKLGY